MKLWTVLRALFVAGTLLSTTVTRAAPSSIHIAIIDYAFVPAERTILVGDSVVWQNDGQELHNVFALGGAWESPALNTGQSYMVTFTTPGTYTYVCSIHSGMLGTITVAKPLPQTKIYVSVIQH